MPPHRKGVYTVSVPSWKRSISKTEYIRLLFDLNIRIGEMVANSPKKYRANYGDFLVKSALEALKYAQIANSIFVSPSMTEADYNLRRGLLQQARGIVENISTVGYIFLEQTRKHDSAESEKIYRREEYLGTTCGELSKKIAAVMKSDRAVYTKK